MLTARAVETVRHLETRIDVTNPAVAGFEVVDSGEVSAVMRHADLPGSVLKRIGGFPGAAEAERYAAAVDEYVTGLIDRGVPCLATDCVVAPSAAGAAWATYVLQPLIPPEHRGKTWLASADQESVVPVVRQVADLNARAHTAIASSAGPVGLAIDSQLSNWAVADSRVVALLDVTTPLTRRGGQNTAECEHILRGFPVGLRGWLRRTRQVEQVYGVHFSSRSNLVDLTANLHKEGRSDLVPAVTAAANRWLAERDERGQIDVREIEDYYRRNARALEYSSRVRRLDASAHRLLRRTYHGVLPTRVERSR